MIGNAQSSEFLRRSLHNFSGLFEVGAADTVAHSLSTSVLAGLALSHFMVKSDK